MSLVAMAFLWTGSQIPVYILGMCSSWLGRVADLNNGTRWYSPLYLQRHRRRRSLDLVRSVISAFTSSCLPLRWLAIRPSWTSLGLSHWILLSRHCNDHLWDGQDDELLHW